MSALTLVTVFTPAAARLLTCWRPAAAPWDSARTTLPTPQYLGFI